MSDNATYRAQLIHCASEAHISGTKMKGVLPDWLRVVWFFAAPVALAFAIRIAWEKTVWTILRGPQMVGFSLMHIHPGFFVVGVLCAYATMLWLAPATVYLVLRRKGISGFDIAMVAVAVFVLLAVITPDTLLASGR